MMLPPAPRGGALPAKSFSLTSPQQLAHRNPSSSSFLFSHHRPNFPATRLRRQNHPLAVSKSDGASGVPATISAPLPPPSARFDGEETTLAFVGEDSVPLEGVIQLEKPNPSSVINKWGRIVLLAGGDVLALLLFSAMGRFSNGFSVFDAETLRTVDPFIAGWFLCAYFLGGYSEDGRGMNGWNNAVVAAAKSWLLGIPVGIIIRAVKVVHIPAANFILVTMGSTAILLIGWRTLLFSMFFNNDSSKKNGVYRQGNPLELFELLTSLVRRW